MSALLCVLPQPCFHMCALLCLLSYVCSHMCAFFCVLSSVCSHMCAFICVLSYVCSHMCALTCVLPYVCSDMSALVCSHMSAPLCSHLCVILIITTTIVSSPFAPPHCLGSLAGVIWRTNRRVAGMAGGAMCEAKSDGFLEILGLSIRAQFLLAHNKSSSLADERVILYS